jgi:hypothetical protein
MLWHIVGARVKGKFLPRRPCDTAWESYPGAASLTRPVRPSLALCECCAGRPVSSPWHCAAYSRTATTSQPSKEDCGTVKKGTAACPVLAHDGTVTSDQGSAFRLSPPALCIHAHHCGTIPGATAPSQALQRHPRHCGSSG